MAVYKTELFARFSAAVTVAEEVIEGISFTLFTLIVTASVSFDPSGSVAMTLKE